ncbi:hypothetical protein B0T20DRAFT_127562 [Sordaria brevicollis]|uniref:Secreted protein n=1 Tax=Sordaria brevicollis TaxID=83679 RepID=A0AAE0UFJ3_SORBR|nr:hypothetical protein B0T20DRAFT_127562 [Sordaria brevicollis]
MFVFFPFLFDALSGGLRASFFNLARGSCLLYVYRLGRHRIARLDLTRTFSVRNYQVIRIIFNDLHLKLNLTYVPCCLA